MTEPTRKPTLVICDDKRLTSAALALQLERLHFEVLGVPTKAASCVGMVQFYNADEDQPSVDLVLLDIVGLDADPFETCRHLREQNPQTKVGFLTGHPAHIYIDRALAVGATGFLCKQDPLEKIAGGIHNILGNETFFSPTAENERARSSGGVMPLIKQLTDAELHTWTRFSEGLDVRDIAKQTGKSTRTIQRHLVNIQKKLQVRGTHNVVRLAYVTKLVPVA